MSLRSLHALVADIGTAVRASRDYSRLSLETSTTTPSMLSASGLLPR